MKCFHVRFGKKKIKRRSLKTTEWRCFGCELQKPPANKPSEKEVVITATRRPGPAAPWGRQLHRESGALLFLLPSASQLTVLTPPPTPTGPGEEEEPFDPLFKTRQPFLSHLIGQDRDTCPPLHQSLAKETRLTVIGLDYSGGGLFPEPMDAQMREDTRRLGPSPAGKKRGNRKKRCGTATHICHGLFLSLLSGYLPQFPS